MNRTRIIRRTGTVVAILLGSAVTVSVPIAHSSELRELVPTGPDIVLSASNVNLRQALEADRAPSSARAGASVPNLRQAVEADRAPSARADASVPNLRQAVEADRGPIVGSIGVPNLRQLMEADR